MSRLISPQAAFNRLLPYLKGDGWITGATLNDDMHKGLLPLYRDGVLLNPTEIGDLQLYVRVDMARNGHFSCTVASRLPPRGRVLKVDDTRAVQMVWMAFPPEPKWEMGAERIEALLKRTRAGHEPEWVVQTRAEMQFLALTHSSLLENFGALYLHVEEHLGELGISVPANKSRFHKAIRDLVEQYR